MFAKFDARNIIAETLHELEMDAVCFAGLQHESSIPFWTIQRALRGQRKLDDHEARCLKELAQECRALQASMPCKINWKDPQVRELLIKRYEERQQERFLRERQQHIADLNNLSDADILSRIG